MKIFAVLASAMWVCLASNADAQVRDRARSNASSDEATIAAGWAELAAGRPQAVDRLLADLVKRTPWNHAAIVLRVTALSAIDPHRALDIYEAWLGGRTQDDAGLLEPIAKAVVVSTARDADTDLRREARTVLREGGYAVPPPRSDENDPTVQMDADVAAARNGDAAAIKRLEAAAAASGSADNTALVTALERAGSGGVPALLVAARSQVGPTRAAAAAALGRMHAQDAVPALGELMKDQDPFARSSAAVALARLGDPNGRAYVQQMLDSKVPDLQLMAAETWEGQTGSWVTVIQPLLENRDGLIRLQAARLLAPVDPDAARRTFQQGITDSNPAVKAEALRAMQTVLGSQPTVADLSELRRLLRSTDGTVRLRAADAILVLVRTEH